MTTEVDVDDWLDDYAMLRKTQAKLEYFLEGYNGPLERIALRYHDEKRIQPYPCESCKLRPRRSTQNGCLLVAWECTAPGSNRCAAHGLAISLPVAFIAVHLPMVLPSTS